MTTEDDVLFGLPPAGGTLPAEPVRATAPLAVRMRPRSLGEVVGQAHLLRPGAPLRRLAEGGGTASVLLYGPPGTGKTTMARLLASAGSRNFVALSALSSGVKELRDVINDARRRLERNGQQTVLFIDEVHRFSKTQQDALLGAVEDGFVLLVAATTENPSFSVVAPLLSRLLVLQLNSLTDDEVRELLHRAVRDARGLGGWASLSPEAEDALVRLAGGDARRALTTLETSADGVRDAGGTQIDGSAVERSVAEAIVRYDRQGDQHYDVTSAFIKSIRGSDPDAALHYLARMLVAGEDPRFIARRLLVHASEDVGLADPSALQATVAAAQTMQLIGMPEARLALAQATVHLATAMAMAMAPKSNTVIAGIDEAMPTFARAPSARCRRTCARAATQARRSSATRSAIAIRTAPRRGCWSSSTRQMRWARIITAPRKSARSARCTRAWPGCAVSSAVGRARGAIRAAAVVDIREISYIDFGRLARLFRLASTIGGRTGPEGQTRAGGRMGGFDGRL
jgi:putative ATPase